jgi:dihydroxy-acid dehydratase
MTSDKKGVPLRSASWFGGSDKVGFFHRSWMKSEGFPPDLFDGRPVIGICNTWSELTPCNAGLRDLAERVKRGVYEAGGFPVEFPVMSLGESNLRPSPMMFRNLASMEVEESIRANPVDGVVLLVGCDKTTPALVMGAASCDVPTIAVSAGPMLSGNFRGRTIGSGTDAWRLSEEVRGGQTRMADFLAAEVAMSPSSGTCNTMGTASTMASMMECLGLALPGNAAIPAVDARRQALAQLSGRCIVRMVGEGLNPSRLLTREAFENAIRLNAAIGGSTNAVLHMLAIAGRIGVDISLDDWDRLGRDVPTIVNLMPSGTGLMQDLHAAGGVPAVMRRLLDAGLLHGNARNANGATLAENCADAECFNDDIIRPLDRPVAAMGGIAVLRGNLAPRGAVLKPSAATPSLMRHRGRAVVFESLDDYQGRIDDPGLDIDESCVMVLKGCGPKGYPGMPEVGNLGLPAKLLARGVIDMVRISDARMSGTAYATVVLHVAPEAADGGPLAFVKDGDMVSLDVGERTLALEVDENELATRRAAWRPSAHGIGGYQELYVNNVLQADKGCDFGFLLGRRGAVVPRVDI